MMANPENTLADWNDAMVKRYHSRGTRFERGFFLKRKMEYLVLNKMINLARMTEKDRVIDIGCGEGFLLKEIKNVAELVGTDISKTALNRAKEILTSRPEIKLVKADAQRIPISDDYFDVILCSEMLEHVPYPKIVLKEFYRILKKTGNFVLSVPNEKRSQKFLNISRKFGFSGIVEGVSTNRNNINEWHLQEASKIWLNEIIKDLFEIKKIEMYPKFLNLRIIALLKKK